jgi:hypothetical protein
MHSGKDRRPPLTLIPEKETVLGQLRHKVKPLQKFIDFCNASLARVLFLAGVENSNNSF